MGLALILACDVLGTAMRKKSGMDTNKEATFQPFDIAVNITLMIRCLQFISVSACDQHITLPLIRPIRQCHRVIVQEMLK